MSEQVLDAENWKVEANAVINDIKDHVKSVRVSEIIRSTDQRIYLNLQTIENDKFCVELSNCGFRVCGRASDEVSIDDGEYFETPYGLLGSISPMFTNSFGNALLQKLNALNDQ